MVQGVGLRSQFDRSTFGLSIHGVGLEVLGLRFKKLTWRNALPLTRPLHYSSAKSHLDMRNTPT